MSTGDDHQYGSRPPLPDDYGGTGQTRTRLPDRAGPVEGGAGRRPSRGLVLLAAVVALLIAAIAFANQGGGEDDNSSDSPGAAAPATDPTAPSGNRPTQPKTTTGTPTGFAHSKEGAQSAAANYAVALGSDGMFVTERRHQILETIYTAPAAKKLSGPMDKAYSASFLQSLGLDAQGAAPSGSTFVSRTVPVGTNATRFDGDSATVAVWYMGLLGMSGDTSTHPVTTTWQTWTFDLQWSGDDWKITADKQKDGPAPVPGDAPASSSDEISKAVEEFGGFTYAR